MSSLFNTANAKALVFNAKTCMDTGNWLEAKRLFLAALAEEPSQQEGRVLLSQVMRTLFEDDDALPYLAAGLVMADDSPILLNEMARVHSFLSQWDESGKLYAKVLVLDGGNAAALNGLGIAELNQGNFDKAEELFHRAISTGKSSIWSPTNLAEALIRQNKYEEAFSSLLGAYDVCPFSHTTVWRFLIHPQIYESQKMAKIVLRAFEKKQHSSPHSPYPLYHLAVAAVYERNQATAEKWLYAALTAGTLPYPWIAFIVRLAINNRMDISIIENAPCDPLLKEYFCQFDLRSPGPHGALALYGDIPEYSPSYPWLVGITTGLALFQNSLAPADFSSEFVNVSAGRRKTFVNMPRDYALRSDKRPHHIYWLGQSQAFGSGCADAHTIPSYIQEIFDRTSGSYAVVENFGYPGYISSHLLRVMQLDLHENDIVLYFWYIITPPLINNICAQIPYFQAMATICAQHKAKFILVFGPSVFDVMNPSAREKCIIAFEEKYCDCDRVEIKTQMQLAFELVEKQCPGSINLNHAADRPHDMGEVFTDGRHYNHHLNRRLAELIYPLVQDASAIGSSNPGPLSITKAKSSCVRQLRLLIKQHFLFDSEITRWIQETREPGFLGCNAIGAIVMNANPFTWGHFHLVEEALKQVERLYLFVVREDRSEYTFTDRLALVEQGVKSFGNRVAVRSSGDFIISGITFPGYFTKTEAIQPADSTTDIGIFGAILAPGLNIRHRFVGEEPHCVVTNDYNETMKYLLPDMGIKLHILARKTCGEEPISASTVRRAIAAGDFKRIEALVPPTTYAYLVARYKPGLG